MSDSRFIINEVQRNIPGLTVQSLQNLIGSSPTLKKLVESGYRGLLTPQDVQKIISEIEQTQKTNLNLTSLAQTINNLQNNPFFISSLDTQNYSPDFETISKEMLY